MNYYAEEFFFSKEITSHSADRLFSLMIYELELTGGDNNCRPFD